MFETNVFRNEFLIINNMILFIFETEWCTFDNEKCKKHIHSYFEHTK